MIRPLSGGAVLALVGAVIVASCASTNPTHPPVTAAGSRPAHYLLVIDFLSYAAEALAEDPIDGSPDAEELIPMIGDPTTFGSDVSDAAPVDVDASTRCGVIDRRTLDALRAALNDRLPVDQRIDSDADSSRSLLHWAAAEGFASLRIIAQDRAGSPSCADAGKRF